VVFGVQIRGRRSINLEKPPLILIDGVELPDEYYI